MYRFIIKKPYLDLLLSIEYGNGKIKELRKKIGMSREHLINVFNQLIKENILSKEKTNERGNPDKYILTESGKKVVDCLKELVKAILEAKNESK